MKKLLLRMKGLKLGGHTHITIWAGLGDRIPDDDRFSSLGMAGNIILRNEEWEIVKELFTQIKSSKLEGKITEETKE